MLLHNLTEKRLQVTLFSEHRVYATSFGAVAVFVNHVTEIFLKVFAVALNIIFLFPPNCRENHYICTFEIFKIQVLRS